jgi:hypothetical protein
MKTIVKGLIMFLIGIFILSAISTNCVAYEIRFKSPQTNETWYRGETHIIQWDEPSLQYANEYREPTNVSLCFEKKSSPQYQQSYTEEIKIAEITDHKHPSFTWTIPLDLPRSGNNLYSIRVEAPVVISSWVADSTSQYTDSGEKVITILDPGEKQLEQISTNYEDDTYWLSRAIMSEASFGTQQEQIAVGWVALNRLHDVSGFFVQYSKVNYTLGQIVFAGFAYNQEPTQQIINLANEILEGKHPDPTNGALYFFSPIRMPKEGENTQGYDVSGGIHVVPGASNKVYFPGWAKPTEEINENTQYYQINILHDILGDMEWRELNGIRNSYFMFYHPASAQYEPGENNKPNDDTISGTSTKGTPGFELVLAFLAIIVVSIILIRKKK